MGQNKFTLYPDTHALSDNENVFHSGWQSADILCVMETNTKGLSCSDEMV